MKINKLFILTLAFLFSIKGSEAASISWMNNLRTIFTNNAAYIYTINMRTFGALDYNDNDIIELELGERKGTFLNAIEKLKNIQKAGANTIYLLPITKTGKLKALGTAGSLYALDSFDTLNPQLYDDSDFNTDDIKTQAKKFVEEAHKLNMHVIVDLPSCGSYDLWLERPELFVKDKTEAAIPSDWTDVRVFKVYENDGKTLNRNLIKEHKAFIDLMQEIGFDGIRADVAAIKPKEFWMEIIKYARDKDPQFLFLAEASPKWENPAKGFAPYATTEELLEAGFDGYYSDWANLSEIKNAKDLESKIKEDEKIVNKFQGQKSYIYNFATHDQVSPASYGYPYWQMVNWLNVTLPGNVYILDGFPMADTYLYRYQNKKADVSYTDDDTYFVHKGKMDIFNYSRAPYSINKENPEYIPEYQDAVALRYMMLPILAKKETEFLSTGDKSVFAYRKVNGGDSVLIIGNLDPTNAINTTIKVPKLEKNDFVMPFKMKEAPITKNGSLTVTLRPYEIQVLVIKKVLNGAKF